MLTLPQQPCAESVKRRAPAVIYVELMMQRFGPEWEKMRDDARRHHEYEIERCMKNMRNSQFPDFAEFSGKLLAVAWREGIFTMEHWQLLKPYKWQSREWRDFIESVYGGLSEEKSTSIHHDMIISSMPWITRRLDYKPMYMDVDPEPPAPQDAPRASDTPRPQGNWNKEKRLGLLLGLLLVEFLGNQGSGRFRDDEHGGRYGYTPGTRQQETTPTVNETSPEQLDADDQANIDRIAGDLLNSIDWGSKAQ